jgi:hypothetical protein
VYQQQQQEQEQEQEQQQDAENPFLDPPFSRIKITKNVRILAAAKDPKTSISGRNSSVRKPRRDHHAIRVGQNYVRIK